MRESSPSTDSDVPPCHLETLPSLAQGFASAFGDEKHGELTHTLLLFCFLEIVSCYVAQTGLELMDSYNALASAL